MNGNYNYQNANGIKVLTKRVKQQNNRYKNIPISMEEGVEWNLRQTFYTLHEEAKELNPKESILKFIFFRELLRCFRLKKKEYSLNQKRTDNKKPSIGESRTQVCKEIGEKYCFSIETVNDLVYRKQLPKNLVSSMLQDNGFDDITLNDIIANYIFSTKGVDIGFNCNNLEQINKYNEGFVESWKPENINVYLQELEFEIGEAEDALDYICMPREVELALAFIYHRDKSAVENFIKDNKL